MEANELMIGDWVCDKDNNPKLIYAIRTGEVDFLDAFTLPQAIGSIRPIPLTPEILEKNGWEISKIPLLKQEPICVAKVTRGKIWYEIHYRIGHYFRVVRFWNREDNRPEDVPYFFTPAVLFIEHNWNVHELQHALRLCGFKELANNFKVE